MRRLFLSASLGVLAATTLALPALADETTPSASESEAVAETDGSKAPAAQPEAKQRKSQTAIEEITVTARKREENLQETPIAITAFGADDLKDSEIRRINDIQQAVPNLQFDQAVGQSNAARIYIRGVGNGDAIAADDPGVGLYVDGVYLPRAQGALLGISDIERVEVLRGPQGTLFGKNTIGGAVNIITQKPTADEFRGEGEIRLGTYDLLETKAVVNVPIVPERFAGRFSFSTQQRDGYTQNRFLGDGATVGRRRQLAARAQFMFAATDNLEFNLSADHSNEPNTPVPGKCKFVGLAAAQQSDTVGDTSANGLAVAAQISAFGDAMRFQKLCQASDADDNYKVRFDGKLEDELKTFGSNLTATWSPSEAFTFKSITAWRRNETHRAADVDLVEIALAQDGRNDNDNATQDAYSQEFNFSGVGIDDRLNWTVGLYGFRETNADSERGQTLPLTNMVAARLTTVRAGDPTKPLEDPNRFSALNGAAPCPANADGTLPAGSCFVGPNTEGFLKSDALNYAAYSQATFDVTEAFSITGGLRFTHERKRIARFTRITDGIVAERLTKVTFDRSGVTNDIERSERFDKWTPMLNLQYRFNDDMNAYLTYSRGFKSGLLNGRANETSIGQVVVDPEVLTSYETGVKSRFFDSRVVLNLAAFANIYRDIQLTVVTPNDMGNLVAVVDNAGKARINGAEIELTALPLAGLELTTNIGITSARYLEFDRPGFKNKNLPGTPAYTGNVAAAYTMSVGSLGDLRSRLAWTHTGTKASDVADPHFTRSGKHGVMSARMSLQMADGKTEIAIFGDNLLGREYIANGIRGLTSALLYYGAPRTYGVELSRKF